MRTTPSAPSASRLLGIYRRLFGRYGPQGWWPARGRFEVIVGAILTQNTAWTNVEKAIRRLKRDGLLEPGRLRRVPAARLAVRIRPAGYFNVKAARLKNFVRFLYREADGSLGRLFRLPAVELRTKLLGVNGIGPETADSIMLYAAGKPSFVIDAYTRRLFSRLGLLRHDAGYEAIRGVFERALPKDPRLYNEYHALIVEHAKRVCRPRPLCGACALKTRCRFARAGLTSSLHPINNGGVSSPH